MGVTRVSFKGKNDKNFVTELKDEVNKYFEVNNISKNADYRMVIKTVVLLTVYFGAYAIIISGAFS